MNRERLAVEVAGIRMATPIMGASGTFGFGMEYEDFLDLADVGAVVSKGITPKPRAGNGGVRIAETPAGMLNSIGLENPGIEAFCRDILPEAAKLPTAFIVNISAGTAEEYGEMAQMLDVDGVDGIEVNISCPNVKEGGIVFGTDPVQAARVTRAVKQHT
ncbi:MAG: dihydroorotate dehydrogenase, partial [Selenomonas sp.]